VLRAALVARHSGGPAGGVPRPEADWRWSATTRYGRRYAPFRLFPAGRPRSRAEPRIGVGRREVGRPGRLLARPAGRRVSRGAGQQNLGLRLRTRRDLRMPLSRAGGGGWGDPAATPRPKALAADRAAGFSNDPRGGAVACRWCDLVSSEVHHPACFRGVVPCAVPEKPRRAQRSARFLNTISVCLPQ